MRHAALLAVLLCSCCSVVHAQFEEFFSQRGGRRGPAAGAGGGAPDTEYYDALGLSPGCSEDEIKKAYRKRALREHPDKGGDPEKFKQLNEAYGVLSDGQKRAAYDQMGKAGVDGSGGGGGGMDGFPGGFGGGSFGGISPEDLFAQFFGGGVPQQRARPRMRDQRMTLPVSLEEMYSGATRRIAVPRPYLGADGRVREERVEVDLQCAANRMGGPASQTPHRPLSPLTLSHKHTLSLSPPVVTRPLPPSLSLSAGCSRAPRMGSASESGRASPTRPTSRSSYARRHTRASSGGVTTS